MKTLVVYDNKGQLVFTQTITAEEDIEYKSIIVDIPEDRVVARVENGGVILEDTPEVKQAKERLKKLNEEISEIKLELLENMEDQK